MPNMNLKKLWRKKSVTISECDPTYKVIYLGNVLTGWAKGDGCVDKPLATLWRNYCQSNRQDIGMKVTICGAGLRAVTQEHGLTEYWAHRVTYCVAHPAYPRVFCWVYRHEGRRLKQELRCHAVLCPKNTKAEAMAAQLRVRLAAALQEFRREKVVRQNARLSLMHAIYDSASLPRRKMLLSTGTTNYRPPLERTKSAPKLVAIEETIEEEEEEEENDEEDEEGSQSNGESSEASVHLHPEEDAGGSGAVSETTSDIVVDYDSSSEAASGGQQRSLLEEDEEEEEDGEREFSERRTQYTSPLYHRDDSLLYCPVPPLSPLDDPPSHHHHHHPQPQHHHHHQALGVVQEEEGGSPEGGQAGGDSNNLGLLASLTRDLTLAPPAEESLTSDQPESLGSHCDSCGSSCGACSDPCEPTSDQDHQHHHHLLPDAHIIQVEAHGKMARLEGDNISEESGYSEDKDSLQNVDATKM